MTVIELGYGTDRLTLTADDPTHVPPQYVLAALHSDSLTASRRVVHHYASGFRDLAAFFESLAYDWRGWPDVREWESVEHDLRIEARHNGHVHLAVRLQDADAWKWSATAEVTLEPGEELSRIAGELRRLAGT